MLEFEVVIALRWRVGALRALGCVLDCPLVETIDDWPLATKQIEPTVDDLVKWIWLVLSLLVFGLGQHLFLLFLLLFQFVLAGFLVLFVLP